MNTEKAKGEHVARKPTKEERQSKEYRNRVLRAHKRMKTLTLEEVRKQIEELQKNCQFVCDLDMLFNSIKTLGAADELAILLKNTRPDVNRYAKQIAKIPIFKKQAEKIGVPTQNWLEDAQQADWIDNPVFIGKLQEYCFNEKKFKEFYRLVGRMD